ncbi:hypothetical protein KKG46_02635 [Patescibacteria group bacterium]|nr:hypothetical protein [Patescibacteria group bacterium]
MSSPDTKVSILLGEASMATFTCTGLDRCASGTYDEFIKLETAMTVSSLRRIAASRDCADKLFFSSSRTRII